MQSNQYPGLRVVVLAAVLTASAGCSAQTPLQPQLQPPPQPAATLVPPPVEAEAAPGLLADAASLTTTQGTVARFLTNPDGDVDGFMTADGKLVRFPPHMSSQLTSAVRQGDSVQVSGTRD